MPGRAAYPGTFNPLTVAHLAVAEAAADQLPVDGVDLVVSRVPLAKEHVDRPLFEHRVEVLRRAAASRPWMSVVVTDRQFLADIAAGYDFLVLGADKWHELHDVRFYGSDAALADALARLPDVAVVPRPPALLPGGVTTLDVDKALGEMSSTAARRGALHLMAPEAAEFDEVTGAWSDRGRYERWLVANPRSS